MRHGRAPGPPVRVPHEVAARAGSRARHPDLAAPTAMPHAHTADGKRCQDFVVQLSSRSKYFAFMHSGAQGSMWVRGVEPEHAPALRLGREHCQRVRGGHIFNVHIARPRWRRPGVVAACARPTAEQSLTDEQRRAPCRRGTRAFAVLSRVCASARRMPSARARAPA